MSNICKSFNERYFEIEIAALTKSSTRTTDELSI